MYLWKTSAQSEKATCDKRNRCLIVYLVRRMIEIVWRRTRWYIPGHNDASKTSRLCFLVWRRFVDAIISPNSYLMEYLDRDIKDEDDVRRWYRCSRLSPASDNGRTCFRWCRPPSMSRRPLLPTRCWASDGRLRTLLPIAAFYCCCCYAAAAADPVVV